MVRNDDACRLAAAAVGGLHVLIATMMVTSHHQFAHHPAAQTHPISQSLRSNQLSTTITNSKAATYIGADPDGPQVRAPPREQEILFLPVGIRRGDDRDGICSMPLPRTRILSPPADTPIAPNEADVERIPFALLLWHSIFAVVVSIAVRKREKALSVTSSRVRSPPTV
jgi:hypothetical protein